MYSYLDRQIPVVFIANTSETFFDYMSRADQVTVREELIADMQMLGDRGVLYPIDAKLVVGSAPIAHMASIRQTFGFQNTIYLYPENPSPFLSLDILRESALLEQLIHYAGAERQVQIIPHATTPQFLQLVESLRVHGLKVLLPESPNPESLWLRDYIDTKAGFRALVSRWFADAERLLPLSMICTTLEQTVSAAFWFMNRGQTCIVKADRGNDGLGQTLLRPADFTCPMEITRKLQRNPFLQNDLIIVEEYIASPDCLFPSIELFVPPIDSAPPHITYGCNQLFLPSGSFSGVLLSRDLQAAPWYTLLVESALQIAEKLQSFGYVGHFDIDAIASDTGQLFLIEINARRTGGTHVHELATMLLGADYLDHFALLSSTGLSSGTITRFDRLQSALAPLLFPINDEPEGLLITHTSALHEHRFGGTIVAPTTKAVLQLQEQISQAIQELSYTNV